MDISSPNYVAILVAAIAAFIFGSIWYGVLSKPWMKAARITPGDNKGLPVMLAVSLISELIMAWVMAGVILHTGGSTLSGGLITGFLVWLGFMATTIAVNQRYEGFGWDLTMIDCGHWMGVALIIGGVIGWWGA